MPLLTETIEQNKYRQGKVLNVIGSGTFIAGAVANVIIDVGPEDIDLAKLTITSTAEELEWEAFLDPTFTPNTPITPIVRNSKPAVKRETKFYLNPTIANDGQAFFANPALIIAQQGVGNRNYIDEEVIESEFKLLAGKKYLIRFTNSGTTDAQYSANLKVYLD